MVRVVLVTVLSEVHVNEGATTSYVQNLALCGSSPSKVNSAYEVERVRRRTKLFTDVCL